MSPSEAWGWELGKGGYADSKAQGGGDPRETTIQMLLDAKCYPHMHPHGTGSVLSEQFSGSPKAHFRNRATAIQSLFRRSAMWAFWKLDWLIKHELFNLNFRKQRQRGTSASASTGEPDAYAKHFGTAIPKNIPERSYDFLEFV